MSALFLEGALFSEDHLSLRHISAMAPLLPSHLASLRVSPRHHV